MTSSSSPAGLLLLRRLMPRDLLDELRARAAAGMEADSRLRWLGLGLVLLLWTVALTGLLLVVMR